MKTRKDTSICFLHFVRHPETWEDIRQEKKGAMDVGLSDNGKAQLKYIGEAFKQYENIIEIYTADLLRAIYAAEIIHKYHPDIHAVKYMADLAEKNTAFPGRPRGVKLKDIELSVEQCKMLNLHINGSPIKADTLDKNQLELLGEESRDKVTQRVQNFLVKTLGTHINHLHSNTRRVHFRRGSKQSHIIATTSGGIITTLAAMLQGTSREHIDYELGQHFANGSITSYAVLRGTPKNRQYIMDQLREQGYTNLLVNPTGPWPQTSTIRTQINNVDHIPKELRTVPKLIESVN